MRLLRLLRIIITLHKYSLYNLFSKHYKANLFAKYLKFCLFLIPTKLNNFTLPYRLRLAFEKLGPVYIKFGQLLSTRPDLLPAEYILELSKLQNQVKPFSGILAKQLVETSLNCNLKDIFSQFSDEAVASASIAQVHYAVLKENEQKVAVKILKPNIAKVIQQDIELLKIIVWLIEKMFKGIKYLKLHSIIQEFEKTIIAELNFLQEAANASELRRLHKNDHYIVIPKVFYKYCTSQILILEWMDGINISNLEELKRKEINLEQLSHNGVAIFYTEVFNYGFFHADMHPGNILCDQLGRYIALDFGIVGCLSEQDKRYLAINIWAFFNRDYKKVALTHVESGWAPEFTSIEELESAIRTVCEPIFNKPLYQISFGQVLVKLFQVSRAFGISVQPQLVLLQKTIINVEGLGRLLNPNLDLWVTAKPILEKWMKKQMGFKGFINNIKSEMPYWSYTLPLIPRLYANHLVNYQNSKQKDDKLIKLLYSYKRQNQLIILLILCLGIFFLMHN